MRLRAFLRGACYRSKVGRFIRWLWVCGLLFLALDMYFDSNTVIENDRSRQFYLVDETLKTATMDPRMTVADLESLKGINFHKIHVPRRKNTHRKQNDVQVCQHPKLDLDHDANRHAFYELPPLKCIGNSLFTVKSGELFINKRVLNGDVLDKCVYKGIERVGDNFYTYAQEHIRTEAPFEIRVMHDFFRIQCYLRHEDSKKTKSQRHKRDFDSNMSELSDYVKDGAVMMADEVKKTGFDIMYENLFGGAGHAREDPDFDQIVAQIVPSSEVFERIDSVKQRLKPSERQTEPMNVLFLGLDSMSHLSFQRKLPTTYKLLETSLGAIILHGYNIVGDATVANMLPLLTGQAQDELPEARMGIPTSSYLDTYPFLWYSYEKRGYATLFAEDDPRIAMFNLRLNGFQHSPTDHYMRPFWQMAWFSHLNTEGARYCLGDKPKHMYALDYARDFLNVYKNVSRFGFVFLSDLTHWDNNAGQYIDEDLTNFLLGFKTSGQLNNTIVIIMGDHGARFHKVRWTVQGKLEERLPMMAWLLPGWFKQKHPNLFKNFQENSEKLTTPFDIYETLLDVLDLSRSSNPPKYSGRGISLFKQIPLNRTCKSAGVDMHWCTCLTQEVVEVSNEHVQNSVAEVVRYINAATEDHRERCEELSLESITSAVLVIPNEKVLRYRWSQDDDHRIASFGSKAKLDVAYFQVTIVTKPGGGMYEATVQANFLNSEYEINADVSRINAYGKQADCVVKTNPGIRKFCYCKVDGGSYQPHRARF